MSEAKSERRAGIIAIAQREVAVRINTLLWPAVDSQAFISDEGSSYAASRALAVVLGGTLDSYDEAAGTVTLSAHRETRTLPAKFESGTSYVQLASLAEDEGGFSGMSVGWSDDGGGTVEIAG